MASQKQTFVDGAAKVCLKHFLTGAARNMYGHFQKIEILVLVGKAPKPKTESRLGYSSTTSRLGKSTECSHYPLYLPKLGILTSIFGEYAIFFCCKAKLYLCLHIQKFCDHMGYCESFRPSMQYCISGICAALQGLLECRSFEFLANNCDILAETKQLHKFQLVIFYRLASSHHQAD